MALLVLWVVTLVLGLNAVHQSWLDARKKALAYAGVVLVPILGAAAALIMLDPNRAPTPSRLNERLRDELDNHKDDQAVVPRSTDTSNKSTQSTGSRAARLYF